MFPADIGVECLRHTRHPSDLRRHTSVMMNVPLRSSPSTVADILSQCRATATSPSTSMADSSTSYSWIT
jgi:hypothetical protein